MGAGQLGVAWDEILAEYRRRPESTTAAAATSAARALRLARERDPRHSPRLCRSGAALHPAAREALRACVAGTSPWPLLLYGPVGTGKTCAALVLCDHVRRSEYHTVGSLCDLLVRAQQGREQWSFEGRGGAVHPEMVWSRLAQAPLLVLDELGARERVSDHHYDCVKRALDERHGAPLVLASNHDLPALARLYDDRVASRLGGGTVCLVGGDDRRLAGRAGAVA